MCGGGGGVPKPKPLPPPPPEPPPQPPPIKSAAAEVKVGSRTDEETKRKKIGRTQLRSNAVNGTSGRRKAGLGT